MEIVVQILVVLGVLAYLGVGFCIARAASFLTDDFIGWWKILLITLLWPLIPFLWLWGIIQWMRDGSH